MHSFIWHLICMIECYISDMWKVLNALYDIQYYIEQTVRTLLFLYMYIVQVNGVITKLLSFLFIKVHIIFCPYCYIKNYSMDR